MQTVFESKTKGEIKRSHVKQNYLVSLKDRRYYLRHENDIDLDRCKFVRRASDVQEISDLLKETYSNPQNHSKTASQEGIDNIDEILKLAQMV